MSPELISIVVLLVMFTVASIWPVNLGVMALVAAFLVGTFAGGFDTDEILLGFPGDLFVLLAGITLLFAIAQSNGTIDLLMKGGLRLVRGNVGLIPWTMFVLAGLLTSIGALGAAAVAIVAPIAMRFAAQYRISPIMMGILVVQGATAGSYSPISPFGVIANGVLESRGLPQSPGLLFLNSFVFNTLVAIVVFLVFGGLRLLRRRMSSGEGSAAAESDNNSSAGASAGGEPERSPSETYGGFTFYRGVTLLGIALLVILTLGFDVDVGFAALTIALVLWLIAPAAQAGILRQMPWPVILLISGILTYVGVLDEIGTIDYMGDLIAGVGSPLVAALAASYVGGLISAFAATAAVLGAAIPLAEPILQNSDLSVIGVVTSIAIASTIVDASPLSTNGALLLANVQNVEERVFFRQLLLWAIIVTVFGPLLAWFVFVVIGVV